MTLGPLMVAAVLAAGSFALDASRLDGPAYGTYQWPVRGRVIRGYEPPSGPYGPGHRGIDIGAPFGTSMVASQDGVVAFAGWVAGALFVSLDHSDGVRTTYSWVSAISVKKGDKVARGSQIGNTGHGHPDVDQPHLHFGARIGNAYIDPLLLLEGADVSGLIHLAPLSGDWLAMVGWLQDAWQGGSSWARRSSGRLGMSKVHWISAGEAGSNPVLLWLGRGPPIRPIQWPSLAERRAQQALHRSPAGGSHDDGRAGGCGDSERAGTNRFSGR